MNVLFNKWNIVGGFIVSFLLVTSPANADAIDDLQPGHWYEVPNSSLKAALGGSAPNIMKPWSGGIFDTKRNRLVIWGGGHGDSWDNGLYAFNIDTLAWTTVKKTTPFDIIKTSKDKDAYSDSRPSSRHTYNGLVYLPNQDKMWSTGGSIYQSGSCIGKTWTYDFTALASSNGWESIPNGKGGCAQIAAYDSIAGHVWYYGASGDLHEFDPNKTSSQWTSRGIIGSRSMYMTAAVDPFRRKIVLVGSGKVYVLDISNPGKVTRTRPTTSGANEIIEAKAPGVVYDPVSDRIIAWSGQPEKGIQTKDVYSLNIDTMVWTRFSPAATNTVIPTKAAKAPDWYLGTYGRFRYVPSKNAFILVNHTNENVYFYKLPKSGGSTAGALQVKFAAASSSVASGDRAELIWNATNATSCDAQDGWTGVKAISGSEVTAALTAATTFTLSCTGSTGALSKSITVSIGSSSTSTSSTSGTSSTTTSSSSTSTSGASPSPSPTALATSSTTSSDVSAEGSGSLGLFSLMILLVLLWQARIMRYLPRSA